MFVALAWHVSVKITIPRYQMKTIKKEKYTLKEIITIAFVWLFAIAMLYIVYIKIKMLNP